MRRRGDRAPVEGSARDRHDAGVREARTVLARRYPPVENEAAHDSFPPDLYLTRLTFGASDDGGVGHVTVVTRGDLDPRVEASSLPWQVSSFPVTHLEVLLGRVATERLAPPDLGSATNTEVARVHRLRAALSPGVEATLRALVSERGYEDPLARAVRSGFVNPSLADRPDVLVVTDLLSDLASGAPVEWVLRRAAEATA